MAKYRSRHLNLALGRTKGQREGLWAGLLCFNRPDVQRSRDPEIPRDPQRSRDPFFQQKGGQGKARPAGHSQLFSKDEVSGSFCGHHELFEALHEQLTTVTSSLLGEDMRRRFAQLIPSCQVTCPYV